MRGKNENTFNYIEADLKNLPLEDLPHCDLLNSRFVLCHLPGGMNVLERLLPAVKPSGHVCIKEAASQGTEYSCDPANSGYITFAQMVKEQIKKQKSSFEMGLELADNLAKKGFVIQHNEIDLPKLDNRESKSILRLGLEEAGSFAEEVIGKEEVKKNNSINP